ncbi:hypothetical protein [Rhizobium sp. AG207R]|uniref:hypothetical protein n=1 Tax=Rhizobium sp. AG207R TaxID=2802287 RepID=UPI0022AC238C|nr:hypothetical protein [Rhizobium sp. AG207R]MCZ3377479.1 hypothetical protein [Rhizobium sp. AG207R]
MRKLFSLFFGRTPEKSARQHNVILMIVKETATGALLSSDYAERSVNRQYFTKIDDITASMPIEHARQAGLDDGWT